MIGIADRFEALLRRPWVASVVLAVAPLPVTVALAVTARPDYPEDACYYGAPQSSIDATDHYVGLMTPLALFAMALVAVVALPNKSYWRLVAPAAIVLAVLSLFWSDAGRPVVIVGANVAVFGTFLALGVLVLVAVAAKEVGWIRAIGWFEFLFLLPILLGVAGLLAQPACYAGDPPAAIPR
jgi:hypothetical protein